MQPSWSITQVGLLWIPAAIVMSSGMCLYIIWKNDNCSAGAIPDDPVGESEDIILGGRIKRMLLRG